MTSDLVARFTKRFRAGPTIEIDYVQATDRGNVRRTLRPLGLWKNNLAALSGRTDAPDCPGEIQFRDVTWFSAARKIAISPQQRDVAFLFQDYALFPHLNVSDNIGFGIRDQPGKQRQLLVKEMIEQFDLTGLERRLPNALSGGQQQRVALARALVRRANCCSFRSSFLPSNSLLREQLRGELRRILSTLGTPTIIVTHDRVEAISLADRVAVMDAGAISKIGTVHDVFTRPKNAALARLVGVETLHPRRNCRIA